MSNIKSRWISQATLDAVRNESLRAHLKHAPNGSIFDPNMSTLRILAALGEEHGEVCRALTYDNSGYGLEHLIKELIQLASVALTWVDNLQGAEDGPQDQRS